MISDQKKKFSGGTMNPWDDEILSVLAVNNVVPAAMMDTIPAEALVNALGDMRYKNTKKCNLEILSHRKRINEHIKAIECLISEYQRPRIELIFECLKLLSISTETIEELLLATPGSYIHMEATYHRNFYEVLKTASSFLSNFNQILSSATHESAASRVLDEMGMFLSTYTLVNLDKHSDMA